MGDLKVLAEELEKAPSLRFVGEEPVWDPLHGEWVLSPVYEVVIASGYSQTEDCQVTVRKSG